MKDCIFCEIIEKKLPASIVYEDDRALAFMDLRPVNIGHVLIIPKIHRPYLHELEVDLGAHLFKITMEIERAVRASGLPLEGSNILQNNGAVAFQEVFHVHLHVIPRLEADKGRFLSRVRPFPTREELNETAEKIKAKLAI